MIDDTFRVLGRLDESAEPDPEFGDRLFATLAIELGYRTESRPARWRRDLHRGLERIAPEAGSPFGTTLRLAYLAALLSLFAAASVGAALLATQLLRPAPVELVRLSQAVYDAPPAFVMEVTNSEGSHFTLSSDGAATWRVEHHGGEVGPSSAGSYWLYTPGRVGQYDAYGNIWSVEDLGPSGPIALPYPFGTEFVWNLTDLAEPTTGSSTGGTTARGVSRLQCSSWDTLGEGTVAGRPADHVVCRDRDQQFWIDRESRLVLAIEAGRQTPNWSAGYRIEATALSLEAADLAAFSWDGPPGSWSGGGNPPASTRLVVGQAAPRWTGTMLDGGTFDTSTLAGTPTAIFFWAPWCDPCTGDRLTELVETAGRHPEIRTLTVGSDTERALRGFAFEAIFELPIVVDDPDGSDRLSRAWGIQGIPALILLDADGAVAGATVAVPGIDLEAIYTALANGQPIPTIPRDE